MALFKYLRPERVDVIEHLRIRFSPPAEFNDPFELLPDTRVVETNEWLDRQTSAVASEIRIRLPDIVTPQLEREVRERIQQRLPHQKRIALDTARRVAEFNRILSLCKVAPDDPAALLMWGHYTNNHRGLVVEFQEDHEWVTSHRFRSGVPRDLREVLYQPVRAGWNHDSTPKDEFLFTKSPHWEYEKEVRLIRFQGDKEFQSTAKADALLSFPPQLLRSVTLGVNNTDVDRVREILNNNANLAHVSFRQAELHADEFRLNLIPLTR